jgi:hypothetical protein
LIENHYNVMKEFALSETGLLSRMQTPKAAMAVIGKRIHV